MKLTRNSHIAGRTPTGTTPFPNVLLDEAMPRLKDSEWRLLCVIARQTLGWQNGNSGLRKERDWLTRSQLMARTGRHPEALSAAIQTLVRQGYITVQDSAGQSLTTAEARRRNRGRTYYGLTYASPANRKSEQDATAQSSMDRPKARKSEHEVAEKANRTKETLTKERAITKTTDKIADGEPKTNQTLSLDFFHHQKEFQAFLELFEQAAADYSQSTELERREDDARLSAEDAQKLAPLLQKNSTLEWALHLRRFFESDLEYIRRQRYSLAAFVNSYHLLHYSTRKITEAKEN